MARQLRRDSHLEALFTEMEHRGRDIGKQL